MRALGARGRERLPVVQRLVAGAARVGDAEERGAVTWRVVKRIAVTIAKLPPPPRSAQNRSSSSSTRRRRAVGGDDVEARDAVEREAERAAGEPHPAAEHEPADADRRTAAGGDRHALGGEAA